MAGILLPARFRRVAPVRAIKRGEVCRRAGSLVTRGAGRGLMRNFPPRVSESCTSPCGSCMACRACARGREPVAGVIRHRSAKGCCAFPVCRVAAVAIGWRHSGTGVAKVTSYRDMRASQRKTRRAVIESRAQPGSRCVT